MKNYIIAYLPEVLFGAVSAMLLRLYTKLRAEIREKQCLKAAICALLRDRIIVIYNRYSEKDYFPIHERENLEHLTHQYYLLGGNGIVKELEARLALLPTEKSEH